MIAPLGIRPHDVEAVPVSVERTSSLGVATAGSATPGPNAEVVANRGSPGDA